MNRAQAIAPAAAIDAPAIRVDAAGRGLAESTLRVGVWLGLAAIAMLFLAFTSAYMVRQGVDADWQALRMPRLLPANTLVLVLSSVCVEIARRRGNARPWLLTTLAAGLLFVGGQIVLWRELAGAGLAFAVNAHASFFYTLTAVHGLHIGGGLLALAWVAAIGSPARRWLDAVALYWHFMGALWLYLVFLLFGVR
jgi:cytochrome c oxidase subunit 3